MPEVQVKEERKRRAEDEDPARGVSEHPAKRRLTSDSNGRSVGSPNYLPDVDVKQEPGTPTTNGAMDVDEQSDDVWEADILKFQKIAIWQQMQEYKRKYKDAEDQIVEFESRQSFYKTNMETVFQRWVKLHESLDAYIQRLNHGALANGVSVKRPTSEFLQRLIDSAAHPEQLHDGLDDEWHQVQNQLVKLLTLCEAINDRSIRNDSSDSTLQSELQRALAKVDHLQTRCANHEEEMASLKARLENKRKKAEEAEARLAETKSRLEITEKRLDKARLGASAGPGSSREIAKADSSLQEKVKTEDELTATILAERRLAELQDMKTDRIKLVQELDQLRLQLQNGDEDKIIQYANLEAEFKYQTTENALIKDRCEKLQAEVEELKMERRKYMAEIEAESAAENEKMRKKLEEGEASLKRLREQRDLLQGDLDVRKSTDQVTLDQIEEVRNLANIRKERLDISRAEVHRLKMVIAGEMGDRALFEFFVEHPDPTANPIQELRSQLNNAEEQIKELNDQLQSYKDAADTNVDTQQLAYAERQLRDEVASLRKKLSEYEQLLGSSSEAWDASKLAERLREKDEELKRVQLTVDRLQQTESMVTQEMENIGKEWGELEERLTRKVFDLVEKEEHIARLVMERARLNQKCAKLEQQATVLNNQILASGKINNNILAQVRRLDEREKNLTDQLEVLEGKLASTTTAAETYQRQGGEAQRLIAELKEKAAKATSRLEAANTALKKRVEQLENEIDARKRVQEQLEVHRKKLEALEKQEPDRDLQRELDNYRVWESLFRGGVLDF
ncbi:hypothetical protein HDV00_001691 [Rhizophlyctis rosea]|nr:hypothetical protein HDV00_001691 [Rhizophlyctis rosea]